MDDAFAAVLGVVLGFSVAGVGLVILYLSL